MSAGMSLAALLEGIADAGAAGAIRIRGLSLDSRRVRAGEAFLALRGAHAHGIAFAPAAVARGAAAVLADAPAPEDLPVLPQVPVLWIGDLAARAGTLAARWYGEPSRALTVIGVTGTNGKTTTVQLLAQAFERLGRRAATIGTLGAGLHGQLTAGERTTPDAVAVHGLLAQFRDAGASHVAMEVSSHALEQGRVNAVDFDLALFTNLTRDHLDYHGSMAAYGAAKARLFAWPGLRAAVINIDDDFGRTLAARLPPGVRCLTTGITSTDADVRASAIRGSDAGLAFRLHAPWGEAEVTCALLGRFNVANLLGVAAALGALGTDFDALRTALAALTPVPGRMSRLGGGGAPLVVVDYAHTPDALEQALTALRAHCRGALICVFGCGGERDAGKRPEMGAIAARLADRTIVTDDNPRGEDGDAIVAAIRAGMPAGARVSVQRDRATAIATAIATARPGDAVLIAGKGHEPYQEIAGTRRPFDDLAAARAVLEARPC